jgi:hypothetical protein
MIRTYRTPLPHGAGRHGQRSTERYHHNQVAPFYSHNLAPFAVSITMPLRAVQNRAVK